MILRHIQPGEIVLVVFDLRPLKDLEAHAGKHIDDLVFDPRDGVQPAGGPGNAGKGDVHGLRLVAGRQLRRLDLRGKGLIFVLRPDLELIDDLARRRTLLLGDGAQTLHQAGHRALFAQIALPELCQLLPGMDRSQGRLQLLPEGLDLFFHNAPRL